MEGPSVVIPSLPVAGRRSEEFLLCFLFAPPFVDPRHKRIFPLDNSRYDDYAKSVPVTKLQKRPASSLETRVFVALLIAADRLSQQAEQLMKEHSLTGTQYNVLRILRGAEPAGLPCKGIGDRMISHDPDMTRLLDRMEKRGLLTRERQVNDRRVVRTRITADGLDILKKLDAPVLELHRRQFRNLAAARLKNLATALEEVIPQTPDNT
jgi:MarR family transcriptional regulator, organic hydroperoxide resistance regulator